MGKRPERVTLKCAGCGVELTVAEARCSEFDVNQPLSAGVPVCKAWPGCVVEQDVRALYGWHKAGRWIVIVPVVEHFGPVETRVEGRDIRVRWAWSVRGGIETHALRKRDDITGGDRDDARAKARANAFELTRPEERQVQVLGNWLWFDQGDLVECSLGRGTVEGMTAQGMMLVNLENQPPVLVQVVPVTVRKVRGAAKSGPRAK